jgi:hypothetical protein
VTLAHSYGSWQVKIAIGVNTRSILIKGADDQLGRGQAEVEIYISVIPRQGRSRNIWQ